MWTLDPIDGTKGFLRGEQYAVCLALIIDARVELGVIGCPNLPLEIGKEDGERGALFVAVRGQGSEQVCLLSFTLVICLLFHFQRALSASSHFKATRLTIPPITIPRLSFLESVEAAHTSHSTIDDIGSVLGVKQPPIRMDSQAKYCCLARGEGGAYLRMPTGVGYKEKIWVRRAFTTVAFF